MGQSGGLGILWTRHLMGWTKLTFRCLPVVHETKRHSWRELPVLIRDPLKWLGEWLNCFCSRYQLFSWIFSCFRFFLKIRYAVGIHGIQCWSVRDPSVTAFIPTYQLKAVQNMRRLPCVPSLLFNLLGLVLGFSLREACSSGVDWRIIYRVGRD